MPDEMVAETVEVLSHAGTTLPVIRGGGRKLPGSADAVRTLTGRLVQTHGGVLLRDFSPPGDAFGAAAQHLVGDLLPYDFASTPRSRVAEGVYSSTEYPADQWIPQHNEQSYTTRWPMKIVFHCVLPAASGGDTPITDSRVTYARVPEAVRARFDASGLVYVRNYGNGLDLPWERAFDTTDRSAVEAFCSRNGIACEWLDGGRLRTRQRCQSLARHPASGEMVWFNQAHLFHVSALPEPVREALLEVVALEDLPRNVTHGDGSPLDDAMLDEIRAVYEDARLHFAWQQNDVLLLDNMLMAHGRAPFTGPRKVIVAMGTPSARH